MLLKQMFEAISRTGQGKTAVVGWGRGMGHKGHMMLASSVITKAKAVGGDPYFVVSRTMGKDDPLSADEKLAIYKKVFPQQGHIFQAASDELPDLTRVLGNLNQQGYTDAVVVVGADQVKAFQYLKNYNGKPDKSGNIAFNFNSLDVISRQETGDPSAGEEGPRATPMRNVLNDPAASPEQQFQVWRDAMSPEVSDDEVRQLMAKAKERMGQFAAPKKKTKEMAETANLNWQRYDHESEFVKQIPREYQDPIDSADGTKGTFYDKNDQQIGVFVRDDFREYDGPGKGAYWGPTTSIKENEKQYHGWEEYEEDKTKQVAEFLYEMNPELFSRYGDEYLMNVIEKTCRVNPQKSITQLAGDVIRHLKSNVAEKMLPKSAFAGTDKHKLGPAAHAKGKQKGPVKRGQFVGGMEENKNSKLIPLNEDVENIMSGLIGQIIKNK